MEKKQKEEKNKWFDLTKLGEEFRDHSISKTGKIINVLTNLPPKGRVVNYERVYINGTEYLVHVLMGKMFLKTTDSKKNQVNHIDGNKLNNTVKNLEWSTASENIKHACKTGLLPSQARAVNQLDPETEEVIKTFDSMQTAGKELGIFPTTISEACKLRCEGTICTRGGFHWEYVDENLLAKESLSKNTKLAKIPEFDNYGILKENNDTYKIYSFLRERYLNFTQMSGHDRVHLVNNENKRKSILVNVLAKKAFEKPEYLDIDEEVEKAKKARKFVKKSTKPKLDDVDTKKDKLVKPSNKQSEDILKELKFTKIPGFLNYSVAIIEDNKYVIYSHKQNKEISQHKDKEGQVLAVSISNDEGKSKNVNLHVLLASTFIKNDNSEIHKCVMHIDGDRLNNKLDNLKWCTISELTKHRKSFTPKPRSKDSSDSEDEKPIKIKKAKSSKEKPKTK